MRVLLTGAGGLLAAAIVGEFGEGYEVQGCTRQDLDISSGEAVIARLAAFTPHVVINCAAYNDVDGAEADAPAALRVNALAVGELSRAARAAGAILIHYSTDFVFDGASDRPYVEDDPPNPRAVYAASKLLGEWLALEHPSAYVLRVESLFGESGPGRRRGSLGTIVARIRAGEPVPVFVDRTVSPSYTADVARATRALVERNAPPGLYHCVNSGLATWKEIAEEAARLLQRPLALQALTLETARLKAPRPKFCALSNARLAAAGIVMPSWQDALARHLGT